MKSETVSQRTENAHTQTIQASSNNEVRALPVIQIDPEDSFEAVLMTLRLQSEPVFLLVPEQSLAFSQPEHFAQVRQVCPSPDIHFVIPPSRIEALAPDAHRYGFRTTSSLEQSAPFLTLREEGWEMHAPESVASSCQLIEEQDGEQDNRGRLPTDQRRVVSSASTPRLFQWRYRTKRKGLFLAFIAILTMTGALLLPILFSEQPGLVRANHVALVQTLSVGQIAFASSGQLNPTSSKGLNDIVNLSLSHLSVPTMGNRYDAWFLPDPTDKQTKPLLLGTLMVVGGKAQLTYVHPDHENLLASWSRFLVTEQASHPQPTMPSLDPATWKYRGSIPDIPTPGDEQNYSLLDHLRHLLARDPTLQQIGLAGGLDTWLDRNAEKILEWSSAARDDWAGQQTDSIHRHMIRVLDYLDGAASVVSSGDLPANTPLLVDPQAGRLGLLEVNPTQALPAYLTHIDVHLMGIVNAPGHTEEQKQRAITIEQALKQVTSLMQTLHQDALTLVRMDGTQLRSHAALTLLDEMVSTAITAYAGQADPLTNENTNGIIWIHQELQLLATMPVTAVSTTQQ